VRAEGKSAGDKIRQEANKQAQDLVNKASNPLQKVAAEKAADKLRDEGEQQAKKVEAEANAKANDIEQKAKNSAYKIMDDARTRANNATK
jgi:vacuolar-type H+-ATPase subunit H